MDVPCYALNCATENSLTLCNIPFKLTKHENLDVATTEHRYSSEVSYLVKRKPHKSKKNQGQSVIMYVCILNNTNNKIK